jgi:hypothetical protein
VFKVPKDREAREIVLNQIQSAIGQGVENGRVSEVVAATSTWAMLVEEFNEKYPEGDCNETPNPRSDLDEAADRG